MTLKLSQVLAAGLVACALAVAPTMARAQAKATPAKAAPAKIAKLAPVTPEMQSYAAHIGAAASALRLNETAEAQKWLAAAPPALRGWEWRYLTAQADQSITTIPAHEGSVNGISLSADGTRAASASSDHTAKIWEWATGKEPAVLARAHIERVDRGLQSRCHKGADRFL